MSTSNIYFVTCSKGYEDLLLKELDALGISKLEQKYSGVGFEGQLEDAYKVCLWSRLASRVLLKLKTFEAADEDALYKGVQSINWSSHVNMEGTIAVNCTINRSEINNSHYASLKTKDAIVDQFSELYETRPSVDRDTPDIRVNVHIDHDQADISIDLSGDALHKRGYRISGVQAPLKENLAAAILMRCGWGEQPMTLVDPMCGSATFLIEALQISLNIAPALKRQYFGFLNWKGHDANAWKLLLSEAKKLAKDHSEIAFKVYGFDASRDSIAAARQNVHSAGFQDLIELEQKDFASSCDYFKQHATDIPAGMVIVNPPYGERLGEKRELAHLYSEMGDCWRDNFPEWKIALFTANDDLAKNIGLRAHRSNSFFNGAIKCKLHQYQIRPALSEEKKQLKDEKYHQQRSTIINRLKKNAKHISRWAKKNNVQAYRLYDADIPEYSAAVDVYANWVHVQEYQAPSKIEISKAKHRLDMLVDVIPEVLDIEKDHIVVKTRRQQKGLAQYEKQSNERDEFVIQENDLSFNVNLTDYLDTGLFLDHRSTRKMIFDKISDQKDLKGKGTFLNLFAYTSSVSVYAAAAGAITTSVDMSNTYINWSKRNFQLNGLLSDNHKFIKADCIQWLRKVVAHEQRYNWIFIDPPTFSNSKTMEDVFDVQKDHVFLIESAMKILAKGGELIFSNNFRKFRLNEEIKQRYDVKDVTSQTIPEDFKRNQKIHHCFIIKEK